MATIEKRGQYQFRAKVRKQGYRAVSKTFNSRKEAEKWARSVESEIDRGSFIPSDAAHRTTMRIMLERYRDEVLPTKSKGGKPEMARLNRLIDAFGDLSVAALDSAHVSSFRDQRLQEEHSSHQTVKHELGLLNRILKHCQIDWGIHLPHGVVTANVRNPPLPTGRDRRLTGDEEEKLLERAQQAKSKDIQNIIIIAIETAARRGEIFDMRWQHIDLQKCTWHIPITKTGVPRTVPLSSRARQVLRSIPQRLDGKVWSLKHPESITKAFVRLCTLSRKGNKQVEQFQDLKFHDLRHEGTSRLFEKGLNIMEVASITGHRDLRCLHRYTHLRAEDLAIKLG
jgi:integrase